MVRKYDLLWPLNVRELRLLAREHEINLGGATTKREIISIIASDPNVKIAEIKKIVSSKLNERVAISGDVLSNDDIAGLDSYVSHLKGSEFEKRVARWAKRSFQADGVELNRLRRGYSVKRPYEIDVWAYKRKRGRFFGTGEEWDIWIECKNIRYTVKRSTVMELNHKIDDVNKAVDEGLSKEGIPFDYGAIVSTSKFDSDAIECATTNDIACFVYENRRFKPQNDVSWI